jgi:hypothetical protein
VLTDYQRALAEELLADREYASGRRRFPRTLTIDDALAITADIHEVLDQGAEARATAARRAGRPLACGKGCTGCCEELVLIFWPEALHIAGWLARPENAETRAWFADSYRAWKERVGDAPAQLSDAYASADEQRHLELHIAQWKKRILCAFNRDGACTVYPVRPLLCRNAHAVETSKHCYGDDPTDIVPVRLTSREFDGWVEDARVTIRAMHHALGGPKIRPTALCQAVAELLGIA